MSLHAHPLHQNKTQIYIYIYFFFKLKTKEALHLSACYPSPDWRAPAGGGCSSPAQRPTCLRSVLLELQPQLTARSHPPG